MPGGTSAWSSRSTAWSFGLTWLLRLLIMLARSFHPMIVALVLAAIFAIVVAAELIVTQVRMRVI